MLLEASKRQKKAISALDESLIIKVTMTPLLILGASLAGRRWGEAVGGWVVGLPLTSGPVVLFLALEQGPAFAAQASAGSLVGTAAQAGFRLAYGLLALRGWPLALLGGSCAFALSAGLLQALALSRLTLFRVALGSLAVTLYALPRNLRMARRHFDCPWWDIPLRMAPATLLILVLTSIASVWGARISGILATFPLFGTVLSVFAHRTYGPAAAAEVLRGLATGLFGFALFFYVFSMLAVKVSLIEALRSIERFTRSACFAEDHANIFSKSLIQSQAAGCQPKFYTTIRKD
jgi:hypothetical protein